MPVQASPAEGFAFAEKFADLGEGGAEFVAVDGEGDADEVPV